MNGHLVTVEVGVEAGTCERVELDGFAFDEFGLEGKNTETVKCRSAVQENRVTFHHILKDIP